MTNAAFLTSYLDTIIALVLIYALLSVLVSILLEWWNSMVKERGVYLQRAIFRMLDDPLNHNFGYLIYHHPMINGMRRDGNSLPHYLAPEIFSNALVDVVAELGIPPVAVYQLACFIDHRSELGSASDVGNAAVLAPRHSIAPLTLCRTAP